MKMIILSISDLNADNLMIALVGYLIVFSALIVLYLVFQNIPKILEWRTRVALKRKGQLEKDNGGEKETRISGSVTAAISTALYLYLDEIHDEEQTVLTIKKVSKTYSPWSSKIYNMRWPLRR